jgi:glycosyltransferase involved in cell wall biosynthesis
VSTIRTSVALATYNGGAYLQPLLDSIAAQSQRPDELVIGDDQSTDDTAAILERFGRTSGITVRFTRNDRRLGSSANFAAVLQRCQGDVILLCDQDDVWEPERVSTSLSALDARPGVGMVFSNARLIDGEGNLLPGTLWDRVFFGPRQQQQFERGQAADVLLKTNTVTGATVALRRTALDCALPIPTGWLHDAWLAFVIQQVHRAHPIREPLIRYRLHAAQQVSVAGWSVPTLVALMRRQDAGHFHAEAANFRSLARHLRELGPEHIGVADRAVSKAEFLDARASGRESLLRCLRLVPTSLLHRRYGRFGLGWKQAVFDLAGGLDAALRR